MAKKKTTKRKAPKKKTVKKSVTKKKAKASAKPKRAAVKKKSTTKKTVKKKAATKKTSPKLKKAVKAPKSTKKSVKKSAAKVTQVKWVKPKPIEPEEPPPLTIKQLKKVKTGLGKRDLEQYRQLLLHKRREILGDVESMETDARAKNAGGNLSNMPVHMADVGSDHYEQEFTLGLVESERRLLREIDEALHRIEDGIYGVCLERGVPIGRPRLDAKPWAKYCIEVARERERTGRIY